MLSIRTFVESFKQKLSVDAGLRGCYERYAGSARACDEQSIAALCQEYDSLLARQLEDVDVLFAPYARVFHKVSHTACQLALLSVTEGARAKDYAYFSSRLLLRLCQAHDWVTQGKFEHRFEADLTTGQMAQTTAILYELLRDALTGQERAQVRQAIVRLGVEPICREWLSPSQHWHALDSMGHNWWLVIICGAGVAAQALREEEPCCEDYWQQVAQGVRQWFRYPGNVLQNKKANFGPEGDYIEFLGYLTYGLCTYAVMEACCKVTDHSDALFEEEFLRPQADAYRAFLYEADGKTRLANFGDTPDILVKHQHVIYYLAARLGRRDLYDWQRRMSPGPNDFEDFLFYAWAEDTARADQDGAPHFAVYPHAGYAVARTGYGDKDRFFAMKTGESWNHNHLDAGSFLLCDGGHEIAVDSGYCAYSRPEYRGYYVTPQAHSVVLLDEAGVDRDTIDSGTKFAGTFPAALDAESSGFQYFLADCTGPYAQLYSRFYRHVLFLKDWIVLIDDLYAYLEGELTWQMHYSGELSVNGEALALRHGEDETRIYPLYPQEKKMDIRRGFRDHNHLSHLGLRDPDRAQRCAGEPPEGKYVALSFPTEGKRGKIVTVFARTGLKPDIEPQVRTAEGAIEILLHGRQGCERILYNIHADGSYMHKNSWLTYEDVYTDASIVYTRTGEDGKRCCTGMINGSLLHMQGKPAMGAMVKADVLLDEQENTLAWDACMDCCLSLWLHGQETRAELRKGRGIKRIL